MSINIIAIHSNNSGDNHLDNNIIEQIFNIATNAPYAPSAGIINKFISDALRHNTAKVITSLFVATLEGKVIAFLMARSVFETMDIDYLVVNKDYHRQGIAAKILAKVINYAKNTGINNLLLEVSENNNPAVALYQKFGFAIITKRMGYYTNGENALIMEIKYAPRIVSV